LPGCCRAHEQVRSEKDNDDDEQITATHRIAMQRAEC